MAIDDSKDAMDNFVEYSFKFCPYCGRNAKLAKQHFETCHDDKHDQLYLLFGGHVAHFNKLIIQKSYN